MDKKLDEIPAQSLKKEPIPSYEELRSMLRREGLKLQTFQTRETFILAWPIAQNASKNFAGIAGLIFAGSLTFLGLGSYKSVFVSVYELQGSWILIAMSIAMHLFVYMAALDSYISHGRAEVSTKKAEEFLKHNQHRAFIEALRESMRGHWSQKVFFRSNRYLLGALILQVVTLIGAGVLMALFVTNNLY